jgi:hypothetical protein
VCRFFADKLVESENARSFTLIIKKIMKLVRTIVLASVFLAAANAASAQCIKVGSPRNEVSRTNSSYSHKPVGMKLRERIRLAPRSMGDAWTINEGASLVRLPNFRIGLNERRNYCKKVIVK